MKVYYVGLDIHKKVIAFCVKSADGEIVKEGKIHATRQAVAELASSIDKPWTGAMEATMFTGWIYDTLTELGYDVKVSDPFMLKAITASKKKSDRNDARILADALRSNFLPEIYMTTSKIRDLRRVLRFRNMMVRMAVRMKNKMSGILMEVGAEYNKSRLHGKRYFSELLETLEYVPESVIDILGISRSSLEFFTTWQKRLLKGLAEHPDLAERVNRLMSIDGVGQVTALTWALEVGEPHRFKSSKKAVSYCGLCSALKESAGKSRRGPLSKQRNSNLQTILIEAAKLAPRYNSQLAEVYAREVEKKGNSNKATIAVARKLVAYLLYVDKSGNKFVARKSA
jgi:transposase